MLYKNVDQDKVTEMNIKLLDCLFAYRTTPCTITKVCPAELLFKFPIRFTLSMLSPRDTFLKQDSERNIVSQKFNINDKVLVRNQNKKGVRWDCGRVMEKFGKFFIW